jgi:hypothetical protein
VVAVVLAGTGVSTALAMAAHSELEHEQERTSSILAEQLKYIEVRSVQGQATLVEAAQRVGVSTEIDWKKYLLSVQATLPQTVVIETVTVDSASPIAVYAQPTAPLQGARVATVTFSAKSTALPDVPTWLDSLATLPGFADALPGSVTLETTSNIYTVEITMHVNASAFAGRFATEEK